MYFDTYKCDFFLENTMLLTDEKSLKLKIVCCK